jgi:hypothetical protein
MPVGEESVRRRAPDGNVDDMNKRGDGGSSKPGRASPRSSDMVSARSPCTTVAARPIFISESMVGHKLGEFALTRTFRSHARDERRTGVR